MSEKPFFLPAHGIVAEPKLSFHPDRSADVHTHPLHGLLNYGPYSRSLIQSFSDPIRVCCIFPNGRAAMANQLFSELEKHHQPRERKAYLIDFPGFSRVFGIRIVKADNLQIELPASLNDEVTREKSPHVKLSEKLTQTIASLDGRRSEFDVLMIFLPATWEKAFYGPADEDFDLHDYLKAVTAAKGIPLQVIREDHALKYNCRCSVMWRLGIALYCKVGGVPWKIAESDPETAYIGVSYAVRNIGEEHRFITCCSQVFDADGAGLQFLAYETNDVHFERENPFLSRGEARRLLSRSLALYQQRHAGRKPRKLIIHKSTEFKEEETDGFLDIWCQSEGLQLIQIQQNVIWRGIAISQNRSDPKRGSPDGYPCNRGSFLPLGGRETLLWTQGNAPAAAAGKNYFKEGKGIPSPLILKRFVGHGSWEEECENILALTKMNWNNDSLYDRLPVTLGYASVLARTIKRMPSLSPRPYEFRFFI